MHGRYFNLTPGMYDVSTLSLALGVSVIKLRIKSLVWSHNLYSYSFNHNKILSCFHVTQSSGTLRAVHLAN